MGGIFISYRREDAEGYAGRLFDKLREQFGKHGVFMDVVAIEPGVDFVDALNDALGSCDVLISVIGRIWLAISDSNGRRRLDDPQDYIRLETKIALERDIKVIPVLIQDAPMPDEKDLPDELKKLARRQALKLSSDRWDYDIGRLVETLERHIGTDPSPQKPSASVERIASDASRPGSFPNSKLIIALALIAVTAASMVVYLSQRQSPDVTPNRPTQVERVISQPKPEEKIPPKPVTLPRVEKEPLAAQTRVVPEVRAHNIAERLPSHAKYAVRLSEDRGTIIISAPGGEETDHISIDPDRVQKIYSASDGKWSLAVIKVRGKQQYGAMPINLQNGSALETTEIPSVPLAVEFGQQDALLNFNGNAAKRIRLQN